MADADILNGNRVNFLSL